MPSPITILSRKVCRVCTRDKHLSEFPRNGKSRDGRDSRCRVCVSGHNARYHTENRDHLNASRSQRRQDNPEADRQSQARYRRDNPDKLKLKRLEHPEHSWRGTYRYRMAQAGHEVTTVEEFSRSDVVQAYGDACFHCGGPFEELDHFPIPVSDAGPHSLENVKPSCLACNRRSWKGSGRGLA